MRVLGAALAILLAGCMDQDPFGVTTRDVAGPYALYALYLVLVVILGRTGRTELSFPATATAVVVNVGLNLVLIPPYGALGSAWATVVTEVLTMALMFATCLWRMRLRPPLRPILAALASAGLMALAIAAVQPLGLVPALVVGGAVYAAAILATGGIRLAELRALAQR